MTHRRGSAQPELLGPRAPSVVERAALPALAAALVVLAYANALTNPFVFDDLPSVVQNASLRDLSNLRYLFTATRRPIVNLSYAVDYSVWQLDPFGYHLTNVLLHAINAVLVFRLAGCLVRDRAARPIDARPAQWAAAALFAVHPALTEAVGYVSGRAGVLAATFALASLLVLRRAFVSGRRRFLVLALALFVLGLGSKETAAMSPFAWLAYDRWVLPGTAAERRRRLVRFFAPLLSLCAAAGAARVVSYLRLEGGAPRSAWPHALTQVGVVWRYLLLLVAPVGQSVVHEVEPVARFFDPGAWLAAACLVALSWLVWRARRRAPDVAFGCIWFAVFLLPSSMIPLAENMSEHRMYEASIGAFLVAGAALARLGDRLPRHARSLALGSTALVALLGGATWARNRVWASPVALWRDATERAPRVWASHYALADALRLSGDCSRAVGEYRAAIALFDREPRAHVNLGICLAELDRADEARAAFQAALRIDPRDARVHFDAGVLAERHHRPDEARAHFEQAIALDSRYLKARLHLARLLSVVYHDGVGAARLCDEAAQLSPDGAELTRCRDEARAAASSSAVDAGGDR